MLPSLHSAIAGLLHERGRLDPAEVAVSFRQPTRQWADSRPRPTLNCFLYAVDEFTELRSGAMQATAAAGRVTQRMPPRRYYLRYQVTAWSSEPDDEHLLIWRALAALARHNPLPEELLSAELRAPGLPYPTRVGAYEGGPTATDLWSALGLPPRPALLYSVVAPLDLEIALDAPMVLSASVRTRQAGPGAGPPDREGLLVGGVVRDPAGDPVAGAVVALEGGAQASVTDTLGRYTLRILRPGPLRITVTTGEEAPQARIFTFDRQSAAYDITLD